MLQLEEILEILRHVSPDHADLSGPAAQELWFRDAINLKVNLWEILDSFTKKVAAILDSLWTNHVSTHGMLGPASSN
jgi:hypothetical protein